MEKFLIEFYKVEHAAFEYEAETEDAAWDQFTEDFTSGKLDDHFQEMIYGEGNVVSAPKVPGEVVLKIPVFEQYAEEFNKKYSLA